MAIRLGPTPHALGSSKHPGGKSENRPKKIEDGADGNPQQTKGEKQKPYHGVENQGEESQGPAKDEEDAPEQERRHREDLLVPQAFHSGKHIPDSSRIRHPRGA
jgi:hypothetical protein